MNIFNSVSKAGIGIAIISVLKVIFPLFGIDVPEESWASVAEAIGTIIGFVLMIYGQLDRKDLVAGVVRR